MIWGTPSTCGGYLQRPTKHTPLHTHGDVAKICQVVEWIAFEDDISDELKRERICAKLACLHAEGKLKPGAVWKQESIIGSVFEGSYQPDPERPGWIVPVITGTAHINGEATLILGKDDPFCWGIRGA